MSADFPSPSLKEILGENNLTTQSGEKIESETFYDKTPNKIKAIGVYISAAWCPSCKTFTKELSSFYENFNKLESNQSSSTVKISTIEFPIIFSSCDKNSEEFHKYLASMPSSWIAIPFENQAIRRQFMESYSVKTIPTLLIFDGQSKELLTKYGKEAIYSDPKGIKFPWKSYQLPWHKQMWFLTLLRKLPIFAILIFTIVFQHIRKRSMLKTSTQIESEL